MRQKRVRQPRYLTLSHQDTCTVWPFKQPTSRRALPEGPSVSRGASPVTMAHMYRTAAESASPTKAINEESDQTASGQRRGRNVSAMDQAQLQRKRQTDRKAQQALRQRVKERVASLEAELARQKAEADKSERRWRESIEALEAVNSRLVDALRRVSRSAEEAIAGQRPSTLDDGRASGSQPGIVARSLTRVSSPQLQNREPVDSPSYLLQVPSNGASRSPSADLIASQSPSASEYRHPQSQAFTAPPSPRPFTTRGVAGSPSLHSQPTCPLDRILLDFVETQRRIAENSPAPLITPSQRLSVAGIVDPADRHAVHDPLSRMLSDVMSTFDHVKTTEKLGMISKIYATTRVRTSLVHLVQVHHPR
jgi:hypothetical protein